MQMFWDRAGRSRDWLHQNRPQATHKPHFRKYAVAGYAAVLVVFVGVAMPGLSIFYSSKLQLWLWVGEEHYLWRLPFVFIQRDEKMNLVWYNELWEGDWATVNGLVGGLRPILMQPIAAPASSVSKHLHGTFANQ
jgi:hypothetical protein